MGIDRGRGAHRPGHGRHRGKPLGDVPAVAQPGPLRHERIARRRPDLRQGRQLLPVRAAVPAGRPGGDQRAAHRRARTEPRAVPARGRPWRPGLHHPDARPPGRARRPLPPVGGDRLSARQARARVQHAGHHPHGAGPRGRRQLHRPERPLPRLRRADRDLGVRRSVPGDRGVHPGDVATGRRDHRLAERIDRPWVDLSGTRPTLQRRAGPAQPRDALHRQQHQHDPAGVQPRRLGESQLLG